MVLHQKYMNIPDGWYYAGKTKIRLSFFVYVSSGVVIGANRYLNEEDGLQATRNHILTTSNAAYFIFQQELEDFKLQMGDPYDALEQLGHPTRDSSLDDSLIYELDL